MALKYEKPPLVEAYCELRFASSPEHPWDGVVPGLLYAKIGDRFPIRKERHAIQIQLPFKVPVPLSGPTLERLQFFAKDENSLVQVGKDLLAVNSVRSHMGWAALRASLLEMLALYREIAKPDRIVNAAVRYINRAEVPLTGEYAMNDFLVVLPVLPAGIPPTVTTFQNMTEVVYQDPSGRLRFRFATTDSTKDDTPAFTLDYEHVVGPEDAPTFGALEQWLDSAHERIEQAFHGSFTAEAHKDLFGGVEA